MKQDPAGPVPVVVDQGERLHPSGDDGLWSGLRFGLPVWLLLAVILPASTALWFFIDDNIKGGARERFRSIVDLDSDALHSRLGQYESVLVSGAELFDFEAENGRRRWREFALPLQRLFPGVQGICYARWVESSEREAFLAQVRAEGFPSFQIHPAGFRAEYVSILYLEPFEGRNLRAFGYDLWSESLRRQALSRARDTGRPSLTGRLTLLQETSLDVQPGLLMVVPAYRKNMPLHSVDERRKALHGFVYSPFRAKDLMRGLTGNGDKLVSFAVYLGVDQTPSALLYDSLEELPARAGAHKPAFVQVRSMELAGQVWTLVYRSLPAFEERNGNSTSILVLLGLLLLDVLLVLLVAQLSGLHYRVERRAELITSDLRRSEEALLRSHAQSQEAYKQLNEVSELHRAILANAGYAIIATDAKGVITTFNPSAERLLGYSATELVGQKTPAIFHDAHEVAQRAAQLTQELHQEIEPGFEVFIARSRRRLPNEFEWSYIRKDGTRFPVLLSVTALSDSLNQVRGFLGIAVDISERKRAEARITSSMREVRDLKVALDAHAIVAITDRQGRITYANDNFCTISKFSRGELLGQDHRIINSGFHSKEFFRGLFATIGRAQIWKGEIRNRAKDGTLFWVDTTIVPFLDEKGLIFEYVVIRIDITMRKQAEQARQATEALLRQFITHTPAAIAMLDSDMRFLHVSDRWISDFKLAETKVLGTQLIEHEALPEKWKSLFVDVMAGHVHSCEEDSFDHGDGTCEWIQWEARPWQKADGAIGGVMIFSQIVTARRQLDLQLTEQNRELARSNSELEQFAYIASHDLQEPLRAVSGCVEILQGRYKGQLDARADELIFHTVDGARRMQTLITDLLAYSRISSKGAEPSPCPASEAVRSALVSLGEPVTAAGVEILYPELPLVMADRQQLALLFFNLIGNSLKFCGEQPAHVSIAAKPCEAGWEFTVADTGIGIDPRYFERIFGIFQRLHTRAEYPGTGIGLAICRKIVERHGGRIWVVSQPGNGATFHFTLPSVPGVAAVASSSVK